VNGRIAEGARGECGRSEGVRGCGQSNAHAAAQGRNRPDISRGARGGSKEQFVLHYMGIWGGEEPEMSTVLSGPGHSLAIQLCWGFSPVSPHQFPHTVPSPICPHPQILWQARTIGLRQPEAQAKQIRALRRHLCPQLRAPMHPLAPPTFPSCSLGNAPIHTATPAPTFIAIAMSSTSLPLPLAPGHHLATNPAHGAVTTRHRRV